MGFPTINGAAINGEEGGDITLLPLGLDLPVAGTHVAFGSTMTGAASPLEMGAPLALFTLEPPGLDLLDHGVHIGLYDPVLAVPGMDIVAHGTPVIVVSPVAGDAVPLEIGALALQIGVQINARPVGLDLVVSGLHVSSVSGVAPSNMTAVAGNARPLELGLPSIAPAPAEGTAGGASPLEMADVAVGMALVAGAAEPLEIGVPAIGMALVAGNAQPMELGGQVLAMAFPVQGIELVAAGVHSAFIGGTSSVAGGARPLEMGTHGPLAYAAITRQQFPLALGTPAIHRGSTC